MSSSEWPSVDAHNVSLPTIVSSTDLFDGELFGDELMDIYNSSAVDDHGVDDIPLLLSHSGSKKDTLDENHPGAHVAAAATGMDSGLGAFRPLTSFSDLTSLLAPSVDPVVAPAVAPVVVATRSELKGSRKRTVSAGSSSPPAPKKKATGVKPRRRSSASNKNRARQVSRGPSEAAPSLPIEKIDANSPSLPDPLSSVGQALRAASGAVVDGSARADKSSPAPMTQPSDDDEDDESEEDYKSTAEAAVENLMNAVGLDTTECSGNLSSEDKIDTSTAYIKELTSNNWVAACAGGAPVAGPIVSMSEKGTNRARKQNLSADERARQNRDRNREHARNTRLRKKAYVEELKRTLTVLVAQRDASELEKRQSAQRELEQREVRYRVLEEFLKLRGRNETDSARWAAILEEGFTLTLPAARYQQMTAAFGAHGLDQVLHGVSEVVKDSNSFAEFLQRLGTDDSGSVVTFDFACDRQDFFMDGCSATLDWTGTTTGAKVNVDASELTMKGLVRGKFSPASNKLLEASISYDTGAIYSLVALKLKKSPLEEVDAAQAAAHQADAFLDSLQVPRLAVPVPSAVTVVHASSSSSEGSTDKGELDSDYSVGEGADVTTGEKTE